MISTSYVRAMATYNRWQNTSLYAASGTLTDAERKEERGAFFGSIHGTLNHLLWGDTLWLSRFGAAAPPPAVSGMAETTGLHPDWDDLVAARGACDDALTAWAEKLDPAWLDGDLFNHQTHHRGQVHAMLTAAGAKPDDTDMPFMPQSD